MRRWNNETIQTRLVEQCQAWKVAEYIHLGGTGKIPIPSRVEVLKWLSEIWKILPSQIARNSSKKCAFTNDVNIGIDVA